MGVKVSPQTREPNPIYRVSYSKMGVKDWPFTTEANPTQSGGESLTSNKGTWTQLDLGVIFSPQTGEPNPTQPGTESFILIKCT